MALLFFFFGRGLPVALVLLWLGSVVSVVRDARARVANPAGVKAAGALALLLPFGGALLYLCIRPLETRLDRRERRLVELLLSPAEGEVELGDVRQPQRWGELTREPANPDLDLAADGLRRSGDEAGREHPADEPLLVDVLPVGEAGRLDRFEEAAAV